MIELFHEGTSHVYNNITCEKIVVSEFGFEHYLKEGWVLDPKDLYSDSESKIKPLKMVNSESIKK